MRKILNAGQSTDETILLFDELDEFVDALSEKEENSFYISGHNTSKIKITSLSVEPMFAMPEMDALAKNGIPTDVIQDTQENGTGLVLNIQNSQYPIRDCCLQSLCAMARINGRGLYAVSRLQRAEIFSHCLSAARGKGLVLVCDDKVSAIHGGDKGEYAILPIPELLFETQSFLEKKYEFAAFNSGMWSYSLTRGIWNLKEHTRDFASRYPALAPIFRDKNICLSVATSDTGTTAARIDFSLRTNDGTDIFPLGEAVLTPHRGFSTVESFKEGFNIINAKMETGFKHIAALKTKEYTYGLNVLIRALMKVQIPQKYIKIAIDAFMTEKGDTESSANGLEIYQYACSCIKAAMAESTALYIAKLETDISKLIRMPLEKYDTIGDIALLKAC